MPGYPKKDVAKIIVKKFKDGGESKPDFLDLDKDGDKDEPMKDAIKPKKLKYDGMVKKIAKKLKDK